jgi:hypothetical protein
MRPGQNKRMRGRNNNNNGNNRKGPNPLTRSYESNGPDVKIRGTAHHIGEKYLQLARDAQSSGDPVMAESYLQHAEHYFRLIAAAQQAQQQASYGYQRPAGEQVEAEDDGDDDDFSSLPDRFASPVERVAPPPPPQAQPYVERPAYNGGGERQPYEGRQDRYERSNHERQERPQHERSYQDRQSQPGGQEGRQERYDNRQDRNGRGERPSYAERNYGDRGGHDRGQERTGQDRGGQDRSGRGHQDGNGPARDYDNRGRNGRGPRDFRNAEGPREPRQPQPEMSPAVNALPAFITTPVRIQAEAAPVNNEPVLPGLQDMAPAAAGAPIEDAGFAPRPRRRRRTKAEFNPAEDDASFQTPASDPVGGE